ncbi:MAG: tripartite tricarboxylate transporter permease [Fuerstiella sp.]|nr:tripartite tricarboxylate transporter permease [Fuerstiella sp.]
MIFDVVNPLFMWWTTLGVVLGVTVGCIPGLTGAMVIALTLPLTFAMSPPDALTLLVAIYVGSVSGGLISATLLNIPGTPASLMTTLDGFPMAAGGRPKRALTLGIAASLAGGVFSWGVLTLLAAPMAVWSTSIGPPDMFSLVMLALVLIAVISRESLTMGLLAGSLGLLSAMPGMHPATGQTRLTFGFGELNDGFRLLPVLIGLFAVSQLLKDVGKNALTQSANAGGKLPGPSAVPQDSVSAAQDQPGAADVIPSIGEWLLATPNLVRSSFIGTAVGILPGVGANIGSILAYATARSQSTAPSDFGTGCEEGIVASEAANNATVGGALIPLISLGIPGSVIDAILLGAFVIHGLQPGPLLFQNNPEIVHTITQSYLVANILMFGFMLMSARWLVRLVEIPKGLLVPVVLTFCVLGSYALANRMFDVWVMVAFGGLGLLFDRLRIPTPPFVIGFVLSPIAEENLSAALMASDGSWWPFVQEPVSAVFLGISAIVCVMSLRGAQVSNLARRE